jgi:putative Holliday junction resolvase
MCANARKFGAALEARNSDGALRIDYFDETFTTVASHKVLIEANISRKKRKNLVDGLAAKILLQKYLDDFNLKAGR